MDTQKGVLHYWNSQTAYGVIRSVNTLNVWTEYFAHISNVISGDPIVGSAVEFEIYAGPRTKARAPAVRIRFSPKVKITDAVIATLTTPVVL
jgi:hypothetical protein